LAAAARVGGRCPPYKNESPRPAQSIFSKRDLKKGNF
jgi:hypothetical protein